MNTSNYPSESPQYESPKKDYRNLYITLLAVGIVGTVGYGILSNSHEQSVQQVQQTQIAKVSDDKDQVQRNFDNALTRLDSLTGSNNKMQGMLASSQKDIDKLKNQIRGILRNKSLTEGEKKKAESLIAEMNQKISGMEQDVTRLTQENQGLSQDNQQLTQDKDKLTSDVQTTTTANEDLAKKVDIASTLVAGNIRITPVQDKKNGEEKITDKAKKVNELKIAFDVSNRIAADGQTDIYVCITGPDGKLISVPAMGSGTFTTRDEGDKTFTSKVSVAFAAGKPMPVQVSWKQDGGFQTGEYKIEIYHNGFKIGEGTKELKKGGLFS
jgi:hypothetical protein